MQNEWYGRKMLTKEALSWERTKFVHGQLLKGVAADCSTFIGACFRFIGLFKPEIPHLPADWFLHTTKEEYLEELEKHAVEFAVTAIGLEELRERASKDGKPFMPEVRQPQPADMVIVKDTAIGAKVFSHGAIVIEWPTVIHCFPPCVMRSNILTFPAFQGKKLRYFNPFKGK